MKAAELVSNETVLFNGEIDLMNIGTNVDGLAARELLRGRHGRVHGVLGVFF